MPCIFYDAVYLSVLATFMSSPPAHIPEPISLLCVQYNVVIVVHGGLSQLMSCLIWCHDLEIDGVLLVVELHDVLANILTCWASCHAVAWGRLPK